MKLLGKQSSRSVPNGWADYLGGKSAISAGLKQASRRSPPRWIAPEASVDDRATAADAPETGTDCAKGGPARNVRFFGGKRRLGRGSLRMLPLDAWSSAVENRSGHGSAIARSGCSLRPNSTIMAAM